MTVYEIHFPGDEYHTPANYSRSLADRMMLGGRWYFLAAFLRQVLVNRRTALQGRYDREEWAASSVRVLRLAERCGGRFHIAGMDHFRNQTGPLVFISNHMSTLENMVFPGIIAPDREVTFVVKESLVRHPFFGPIMRSRDPIVVHRSDPKQDFHTVMNEGRKKLEAGISVILFPQSTRTNRFIPSEFNTMGVKLAREARVPVIPVAVKTDFWENGTLVKDLGPLCRTRPIHIEFGSPMIIAGPGKEENRRIIDFISSRLTKWHGTVVGAS